MSGLSTDVPARVSARSHGLGDPPVLVTGMLVDSDCFPRGAVALIGIEGCGQFPAFRSELVQQRIKCARIMNAAEHSSRVQSYRFTLPLLHVC